MHTQHSQTSDKNTFELCEQNSKVSTSYNEFMTSLHLYKTLVEP